MLCKQDSVSVPVCCFFLLLQCLFANALSVSGSSGESVCGNGVRSVSEECDDGNVRDGDGCSSLCRFEDPCGCAAGDRFLCNDRSDPITGSLITVCCPALVNPVTNARTCNCAGQMSPWPGMWVAYDCSVYDIDECEDIGGTCAMNALCINKDARPPGSGNPGFECVCNYFGDGVTGCDTTVFRVSIVLGLTNSSRFTARDEWLVQTVAESVELLFPGLFGTRPRVSLASPGGRRLLSANLTAFTLVFTVSDWDTMQEAVATLNAGLLADFVENRTGNLTTVSVLQEAVADVEQAPVDYTVAQLSSPGFRVQNFTFQREGGLYVWDLQLGVFAPSGYLAALFLTREHAGDSLSAHECVSRPDFCCLLRMQDAYYLGDFGSEARRRVAPFCRVDGDRGPNASSAAALVSSAAALRNFNGAFWTGGVVGPLSSVAVGGRALTPLSGASGNPSQLLVRLSQSEVMNLFAALQTDPDTGVNTYTFAIGMLFVRGLNGTAQMNTVVAQTRLAVNTLSSSVFVSASAQQYSWLGVVQVSVYELTYSPRVDTVFHLQFARASVLVPPGFGGASVLGSSVQFAVAPNASALRVWTNPCFSDDDPAKRSGARPWDFANSTTRVLYEIAAFQPCSMRGISFCTASATSIDQGASGTLLTVDVPLLGELIADDQAAPVSMFVRFLVSATNTQSGAAQLSQVSTQLVVDADSGILRLCQEGISSVLKDTDFVSVSLGVGGSLQPVDAAPGSGPVVFRDFLASGAYEATQAIDAGSVYTAVSTVDSLITVVLDGSPAFFTAPGNDAFTVEIDDVLVVHVRNEEKYAALMNLTRRSDAFEVHPGTGGNSAFMEISLTSAAAGVCNAAMSSDCAVSHPVHARTASGAAWVLQADVNADIAWLLSRFGDTPAMRDVAAQFALGSRNTFGFNWRYRRGWWIQPVFAWPGAAMAGLQDRAILFVAFGVDRH